MRGLKVNFLARSHGLWLLLGLAFPAAQVGACAAGTSEFGSGVGGASGCEAGLLDCAGACVSPETDPANCGACGKACAAGESCHKGKCVLGCAGGSTACGGKCVDMANDPVNCGACDAACAEGEVCQGGKCGLFCAGGTTKCEQKCVDTQTDAANCGGCGKACAEGEVCQGGKCGLLCAGGTTKCEDKCVDTQSDAANCGGCAQACPPGYVCWAANCSLLCGGESTKCGDKCVDTANDPANCGGCGKICVQGQVCQGAQCGLQCAGGTTKCGNLCVNLDNDPANCGGCAKACAPVLVWQGAQCVLECAGGSTKCGSICVDTKNDPKNCGACAKACAGGEYCANGACSPLGGGGGLQNEVLYGGYYYATLDDVPPAVAYGAWKNTCQTDYLPLLPGWELVPEDAGVVANVIKPNIYGTHCILFANGVSYGVSTYNNGQPCGCSGNQCMAQSGNQYAVASCSRRILIRRAANNNPKVPGFSGEEGPAFGQQGWVQCEGYLDKAGGDHVPKEWGNDCTDLKYNQLRVVCGASPVKYRYLDVKKNVFRDGLSAYPETGLITAAKDQDGNDFAVKNEIYAAGNHPHTGTSWWNGGDGCNESAPNLTVNNACSWEAANCFGQGLGSDRYLWIYVKP
ncbi:MAG: hypothetical protein HY744_09675 [Deltaproteobacteria bacterium]|nr:hypothetical protein [Deltaproteobacteria bacterium]